MKDPLTREPDGTLAKAIVSRLNNDVIYQLFRSTHIPSRAMMNYKILIMDDGLSHNVIKVKPPLCFTHQNADSLLRALDEILNELGK